MKSQVSQLKKSQKVAVPYYGAFVRPKAGFEKLYLIATVDATPARVERYEVMLWDSQRTPRITDWFQELGVTGMICSDARVDTESQFQDEGIWVKKGKQGEASELIEQFAGA